MLCVTGPLWGNNTLTPRCDTQTRVWVHFMCLSSLRLHIVHLLTLHTSVGKLQAQRCKQSQPTRKRNGEALPGGDAVQLFEISDQPWAPAEADVGSVQPAWPAGRCTGQRLEPMSWTVTKYVPKILLSSLYLQFCSENIKRKKLSKDQKFCNWSKDKCMSSLSSHSERPQKGSNGKQRCLWKQISFFWSHFIKELSEPRGNI